MAEQIDPMTLVVIAAAVAAVVGPGAKIRRVTMIKRTSTAWAQQGRAVIHGSHAIGKSAT